MHVGGLPAWWDAPCLGMTFRSGKCHRGKEGVCSGCTQNYVCQCLSGVIGWSCSRQQQCRRHCVNSSRSGQHKAPHNTRRLLLCVRPTSCGGADSHCTLVGTRTYGVSGSGEWVHVPSVEYYHPSTCAHCCAWGVHRHAHSWIVLCILGLPGARCVALCTRRLCKCMASVGCFLLREHIIKHGCSLRQGARQAVICGELKPKRIHVSAQVLTRIKPHAGHNMFRDAAGL